MALGTIPPAIGFIENRIGGKKKLSFKVLNNSRMDSPKELALRGGARALDSP